MGHDHTLRSEYSTQCPPWCRTGSAHLGDWLTRGDRFEHRGRVLLCPTAHTEDGALVGLPVSVTQLERSDGELDAVLIDINGIALTRAQALLLSEQLRALVQESGMSVEQETVSAR